MIELINFQKSYQKETVFTDFNLKIQVGECIGIYGPSGCGKTTLLQCISGLDMDYQGDILLNNALMTPKVKPSQRNISLVMQEPVLWPHMTVKENILFPLSKHPQKNDIIKYNEICESLDISNLQKKHPHAISGGQAKRVSLARAMMAPKDILLLDEPLSNVDKETKKSIQNYLKHILSKNKTAIYISHEQAELESVCDRIICIK